MVLLFGWRIIWLVLIDWYFVLNSRLSIEKIGKRNLSGLKRCWMCVCFFSKGLFYQWSPYVVILEYLLKISTLISLTLATSKVSTPITLITLIPALFLLLSLTPLSLLRRSSCKRTKRFSLSPISRESFSLPTDVSHYVQSKYKTDLFILSRSESPHKSGDFTVIRRNCNILPHLVEWISLPAIPSIGQYFKDIVFLRMLS